MLKAKLKLKFSCPVTIAEKTGSQVVSRYEGTKKQNRKTNITLFINVKQTQKQTQKEKEKRKLC